MTDPALRRNTALHEASHAVLQVVLGQDVQYVSIRPGKTYRDRVRLGVSVSRLTARIDVDSFTPDLVVVQQSAVLRAAIERDIIISLAGDFAAMYLGTHPAPATYDEAETEAIARRALSQLGPRVAELVVAGEEAEPQSEGDWEQACDLAHAFAGPDAGAYYLHWLSAEMRTLVIRYRAAILRVADALERHAVLRGDQVAALVYPPKPERS